MTNVRTVAVIGVGKLGTVIARHLIAAGYDVVLAGSGAPERLELIVDVMLPGARVAWTDEAVAEADLVVLALPFGRLPELAPDLLAGTLVVDATNSWPPTDGALPDGALPAFAVGSSVTSLAVERLFPDATIVKSFSHLGYHDLDEGAAPAGTPDRVAVAVAGDDVPARIVAEVVDRIGFDPVLVGPLASTAPFAPGGAFFGRAMTRTEFDAELARERRPIGVN